MFYFHRSEEDDAVLKQQDFQGSVSSSSGISNMGKENVVSRPLTRAFASALRASTTENQQRANTKRPASEDVNVTAPPNKKKKRAVLGDISNASFSAAKLEVVKTASC